MGGALGEISNSRPSDSRDHDQERHSKGPSIATPKPAPLACTPCPIGAIGGRLKRRALPQSPGAIIRLSRDRNAETHPVVVFPPRTPPDQDNKPTFFPGGDDGPRTKPGEVGLTVCWERSGVPCRIKIKYSSGGYANWYCVTSPDGTAGWQAQKPDELSSRPIHRRDD